MTKVCDHDFHRVQNYYFLFLQAFANEANMRVAQNLGALRNPTTLDTFNMMSQISKNICENNAPVQGNPLGI